MNPVAEEILMHYGTPRHSGRYPWGSGEHPYQHSGDFLSRLDDLEKEGMSQKEIAEYFGMTVQKLRIQKSLATNERRAEQVGLAEKLKNDGLSTYKIAEQMGISESSVRSLLNQSSKDRMNAAMNTADFLRGKVNDLGIIDISKGVESSDQLGVSETMMKNAVYILEREGYEVYERKVAQATNPGRYTTMKVLCPPGTPYEDIWKNENINSIDDYVSRDGGKTFKKRFVYPASMDSSRLSIVYGDQGGTDRDGLVELRRGVPDLDLGNSRYAQVRILVDGTHYIKGMAVYADDLPDGIDVRFNTNKDSSKSKLEVLKPISDNPDNPFGSLIKEKGGQSTYLDVDGNERLSLINKRAEEGDWQDWSRKLPSQFLAKQPNELIKKQLDLTKAIKNAEFEEIDALTNGTVKKKLLEAFADDCDNSAVHLKAAALPRQQYQVILPLKSIKDNEVYAPNFRDGEEVALVRFPHGGIFEIPILKVNNKNKEGINAMGSNPFDAIGINSKVAEQLSGADFDGDTVVVIPTKGVNGRLGISSARPLKELKGFDPKMAYPETKGMKYMKNPKTGADNTQNEMGRISNLITDMTLKGATDAELAKAVKHSMVVIDAAKHKLNYKQSEVDNGITELKKKYQGRVDPETGRYREGASTLISRASAEKRTDKRVGSPRTNIKGDYLYDPTKPEGAKVYKTVKESYIDKNGKTKYREYESTEMAETTNAYTLSSGTIQEKYYADYANYMKSLANKARKTAYYTKDLEYSPEARKKYPAEVASINTKLKAAIQNKPKERMANLLAESKVKALKNDNPDMTKKEIKKARQMAIEEARNKVGAERTTIEFTDREWEAVQAGAITKTTLKKVMESADMDKLKERATPKDKPKVSDAQMNRMMAMYNSGYTMAEIADALGVSGSTVQKYIKESKGGE